MGKKPESLYFPFFGPVIHFKLIHTQEDKIVYRPLLDPSRDAGLIQRLPDFLTHDIVFRKDILGLFHWKLCQTLQNVDTTTP